MAGYGWEYAEEAAEKAGGGIFVKLANDGDKVVLLFIGAPYTYEVVYNEKTSSYDEYTKEHEAAGKKPSFKYKYNVFVPEERAVKIYECNVNAFKDILAVKKKYGLENKLFEIIRKGKKGDTKTTYSVLPERDITADERAFMSSLPLHNLADKDADKAAGDKASSGGFSTFQGAAGPESPIDAKKAEGFTARLKVLPRAQIDKFLTRLAVAKIKEVKTKDAELAERFITFLEGKGPDPDAASSPAPAPAENDPFA